MKRAASLLIGALFGAFAYAADPQVAAFNDSPDPVAAGGVVTYTVRIDNSAVDSATNVVVTVPVPVGATFVSATSPCVLVSSDVVCNLGTVGGNGSDIRNLDIRMRADVPGPAVGLTSATLTSDNDSNTGNNQQFQTTTVSAGADLALTKTGSPDPVVGGADITYVLTASNAGPNDSGAIEITDTLSPSVAYQSFSGSGWSCTHSAGIVRCSRTGPHAVGAAIPPLTIVGRANATGGTVTNTAIVAPAASGGTPDPNSTNNRASVDTQVLPGADVHIAQKRVTSANPAIAGQNVTFEIQPRNGGPADAVNAVVVDTLPAGWTFVSASSTANAWSCSAAGQNVSCSRASFPMGATQNITIVATAPDNASVGPTGTQYTNQADITSDTNDPRSNNNRGTVNINVLPDGADLRISKTKTPNPVAQGSTLTSTIRVTNNGPRTATGTLRVVEVLTGETFTGFTGTNWSCSANGNTVVCDHLNPSGLAANASLDDLVITSIATVSGSAANTACTGSSVPAGAATGTIASPPVQTDPNPTNDCATVSSNSTTVQPDLAISKATSTPVGGDKTLSTSEAAILYTLVVTNASSSPQSATGVVIRDTVPAYISGRTTINAVSATASGGSTATFSCAIAGASVTCTQSGGVLAQGETVTVPITVNRPMQDGSFTNRATVSNTVEGDPNGTNNEAIDSLITIDPIADVQITGKTVTPTSRRAGEEATYVISYRNNGPSTAEGVTLTDVFTFAGSDTGATVVEFESNKPGSTCSISAGAVLAPGSDSFSCNLGTLANGATQSIRLVVRPNYQPGNGARIFLNTATISTTSVENPAGGDNGNNSGSATLTVDPSQVDLLTNKEDLEDPVPFAVNGFINYRVRVTSNGPSFATGVRITEVMTPPAGRLVRLVCDTDSASSATCNSPSLCTASNVTSARGVALPTFTCDLPAGTTITGQARGDLAANQSKDIFLRFEVLDQPAATGDVYVNRATVGANEFDPVTSNDSSEEPTTVRQRVDLAVSKVASASTVTLRQPFDWTVTVTNNGPGTSLQTDLTDTLPSGVTVTGAVDFSVAPSGVTGACTVGSGSLRCSLGELANGAVATITIPARVDTYPGGGSLTNQATVDTEPNKIGGVDPVSSNNSASSTVAVTRSSISGAVFQDRDRSGSNGGTPQSAASEPRIADVTLTLAGIDAYGNAVNVSAVTDGSGNYTFRNLSPSDSAGYTITQTQPSGFVNSPSSPPTSGATAPSAGGSYASGGTAGDSTFTGVLVGGNTTATRYNFPEVRQPTLSGFVYIDTNQNQVRDPASDLPINGATVRLLNAADGSLVTTTMTNASGAYSFTGIDPFITYTVEEPLPSTPASLRNGAVNPGLVNGAACSSGCTAQPDNPDDGTDRIAAIDLSTGADGTLFNFGELQPTSVAGRVYLDNNNNGIVDTGETGISGVTITLTGTDEFGGSVSLSTITDDDGAYSFNNLRPGTYTLTQPTQPAGTTNGITTSGTINGTSVGTATSPAVAPSRISAIVLPSGDSSIANNFGEIGDSPDLRVSKTAVETRFTVNNVGNYTVRVRNVGLTSTNASYSVSDRLPAGLTLESAPTGTGWACDGVAGASSFSCASGDTVASGASNPNPIAVMVRVGVTAAANSPMVNVVLVEGGGENAARAPTQAERDAFTGNPQALPVCSSTIDHNACRQSTPVQSAASLSGTTWYDIGSSTNVLDGGDRRLAGWRVEALDANGRVVATATTGSDGSYRIEDLLPGVPLSVRFRDPGSSVVWGYPVNGDSGSSVAACDQANAIANGTSSSCAGGGANPALTVVLAPGQDLPQQSLPVDPSGVVYDSTQRQPVPGSVVTIAPVGSCPGWDPTTGLVGATLGGYTLDGSGASMTVGSDGFYQFLFSPSAPASCTFGLSVTPPSGYVFVSVAIPPATGPLNPPGGPGSTFPVQPQATAPSGAVGTATTYYLSLTGGSGGANIIHNHIPLDPASGNGLSLSKTGDKQTIEVGDSIRYTLTVSYRSGPRPTQVSIVDRLPAGFTYIPGTAIVNGSPVDDPSGKPGPALAFNLGSMASADRLVLQYRARAGVGSAQGDGINRATGYGCFSAAGCVTPGTFAPITNASATNEARHRVRITGGVFTSEACMLGKIFVDCNGNHLQDAEELGIPGVRMVMSDGTMLVSDVEGKYSMCGLSPRSTVIKADQNTLPRGSRLTISSNRNLGDADSLWLDLKNGELHRADFIEGSCSNTVVDQVKARRAQGEVRSVETEKPSGTALQFEGKAHGLDRMTTPQQGTETADQPAPKARDAAPMSEATPVRPTDAGPSAPSPDEAADRVTVGRVVVEVAGNSLPADGQTPATVTVRLYARDGQPMTLPVDVTVEHSAGRVRLPGARTDEFGPRAKDTDRIAPGVQMRVEGGVATFTLLAPMEPQDVRLRVSAAGVEATGLVTYLPDMRPMVAAGLIEGVVNFRGQTQISPARRGDAFEREIESWSREFNNGKASAAARTAVFLKGTIRGDVLLTAGYDSDKETRNRLLRDVNPDEFYPVYGDSSLRSFDAKSASKLYVRLDKGRDYLLFGDFVTGDGFSQPIGQGAVASLKQRSLGNTNRTATGVRAHREDERLTSNAYVFNDSLRQVVEEFASQGSGPYGLRNSGAIEGSEKIEVIVRDRMQTSRILSVRPLARLADYSFEPFSGRILLYTFLPSVDENLNPVSLRVTYEVDQGGDKFWVYGGDAQYKLTPKVEVGGSAAIDTNDLSAYRLYSANTTLRLGERTAIVAEVAQSSSEVNTNPTNTSTMPGLAGRVGEIDGRAWRVEFAHDDDRLEARAFIGRSDPAFNNPSAPLQGGRGEAMARASYALTSTVTAYGEALGSEDRNPGGGDRTVGGAGLRWQVSDRLTLDAGLRSARETIGTQGNGLSSLPFGSTQGLSGSIASGSGGGALGYGNQALDPSTGLPVITSGGLAPALSNVAPGTELSSDTVRIGAGYRLTDRITLGGEVEHEMAGDERRRFALGADLQIAERTRLYGRYEHQTGWTYLQGVTATDSSTNAFVFGVDSTYVRDTQLFSEYRLRDAISGRDLQLASGVRNFFDVREGLRVTTAVEHIDVLSGQTASANAVSVGLDYTANELWRGSTRIEVRRSGDISDTPAANEKFTTTLWQVMLARKLARDWTLLGRNYLLHTNYTDRGDILQNRAQLGVAYRDTDTNRVNALAKIEHKLESDASNESTGDLGTRAFIASAHADWHPSRPWWLTGRIAGKWQQDRFELGVRDSFNAQLASGRVVYDLTEKWDLGALVASQFGQYGARQSAAGLEAGYLLQKNLWLSVGFNVSGFRGDADLVGYEYTQRGAYVRLRFKFDENVFGRSDPAVDRQP